MDKLSGEFILTNSSDEEQKIPENKTNPQESEHKRKSKIHFFSAFSHLPADVSFAEQEDNETIHLLLRRHFVINVPWIALVVFLSILPVFFPFISSTIPLPNISPSTLLLLMAFYYLIIFGLVLLNFTLWYFHVGLVTSIRILDIDLAGILYRQVTVTRHENVEDVTYDQAGFIPSLFNYGNVHIQTAGTQANVEFDRVPKPSKVADIIGDLANPV